MATITTVKSALTRLQENVSSRFDTIDKRFNEQRYYIDQRIDTIDKRFNEQRYYIDQRIDTIDKRIDSLTNTFGQMTALVKNSNATYSWSTIYPIPYNGNIAPQFPDKVVKFWHLKNRSQRSRFLDLLLFYHVLDGDETALAFEQYVDQILTEAHARLAEAWGMNYSAVALEMEVQEQRGKQQEDLQQHSKAKRGLDEDITSKRYALRTAAMKSSPSASYTMLKSPPPPPTPQPDSDVVKWETDSESRKLQQWLKTRRGPPQAQQRPDTVVKPVSIPPLSPGRSEQSTQALSPTQRLSRSSDTESS